MPSNFPTKKVSGEALRPGEDPNAALRASDWNGLLDHVTGWVNLLSWANGATINDGTTDATSYIVSAVAALHASMDSTDYAQGGGGVLYVPGGLYLVTAQVASVLDGISIIGEGANRTAFKVAIGTNPTATDVFKFGNNGGARRVTLRDFSMFADTNYGTNKCRDFIYIDGSSWWRIENVNLRNAGRYGLRVGGTLGGTAKDVHVSYCGESGVCLERSSGSVDGTTADFYHLYSHNNQKHGVHVRAFSQANLYSPILEYNGAGGDATQANGIRVGDTGLDLDSNVNVYGGYFESNLGWDIHTGTGLTNSLHKVNCHGAIATAIGGTPKTTTYGFFYGSRAWGTFCNDLLDYTSGNNYKTYSIDSTCKVSIVGNPGNANNANAPTMRDLGNDLNAYPGGLVQWPDVNGEMSVRGRHTVHVGGPGASRAVRIERANGGAKPTSGTYSVGDIVLKEDTSSDNGRSPLGWRNIASGSPGTFDAMFVNRLPIDGIVVVAATAGANAVDASYSTYILSVGSNLTFSVGAPNGGGFTLGDGRVFSVRVENHSGGNLTGMTWNAAYKFAGNAAPSAPTNGRTVSVTFVSYGSVAFEVARATEVPW